MEDWKVKCAVTESYTPFALGSLYQQAIENAVTSQPADTKLTQENFFSPLLFLFEVSKISNFYGLGSYL